VPSHLVKDDVVEPLSVLLDCGTLDIGLFAGSRGIGLAADALVAHRIRGIDIAGLFGGVQGGGKNDACREEEPRRIPVARRVLLAKNFLAV
jgi:hypothetical protein